MLCERLTEELSTLAVNLAKKEREELRKQRLKFVDISVSNILKKQNSKATNRRKGSVGSKDNSNEATDYPITEEGNENDPQLSNENVDNSEHKSKNKSKYSRSRRAANNEGNDREEGNEDDEEEDEEESANDDDIGRAVWSDDDEEDDEDEDKFVAIKSRRNRNRKNINYKFSEFDELIKSAIEQGV